MVMILCLVFTLLSLGFELFELLGDIEASLVGGDDVEQFRSGGLGTVTVWDLFDQWHLY